MTETAVLLCGHGSRDPDAIAEFELAAAALCSRLQHDFATGYLEFAHPTIQEALGQLTARGARQILAVPGMLFAASHVKYDLPWAMTSCMADNPGIEAVAVRFPGIEFVKALYLRDHPEVIDAFVERVAEFDYGDPSMNCQLCKYRTRIVGYETEIGMPQAAHHHHVRGGDHGHDHHHH